MDQSSIWKCSKKSRVLVSVCSPSLIRIRPIVFFSIFLIIWTVNCSRSINTLRRSISALFHNFVSSSQTKSNESNVGIRSIVISPVWFDRWEFYTRLSWRCCVMIWSQQINANEKNLHKAQTDLEESEEKYQRLKKEISHLASHGWPIAKSDRSSNTTDRWHERKTMKRRSKNTGEIDVPRRDFFIFIFNPNKSIE